jgi:hypothetical protein
MSTGSEAPHQHHPSAPQTTQLVRYDAMVAAIAAAHRVDEVKEIRDRAIALRAYTRIATDQGSLAEIKARAERRAGELLRGMPKQAGARGTGKKVESTQVDPTLRDLGITKDQSSDWQKIASIPEGRFEQVLAAKKHVTTKTLVAMAPKKPTTTGKASAVRVLKETKGSEVAEAAGSYLAELVRASKSTILRIKETVKAKHGVSTEDYEAAVKAVENLSKALENIAPRWQCQECQAVLDVGEDPDKRYECGECGDDTLRENRCESCNKFASKVTDEACAQEECEGEMALVGWETVLDLIAARAKKEEEEDQKWKAERIATEKFAKTRAGKAQAAKEAAEREAERVARLKEEEDDVVERARLIGKGRAEGQPTERVQREEEKAERERRVAENKARWPEEAKAATKAPRP